MGLDLTQPISVENWIFLQVARVSLAGELGLLDSVVAKVEAEIESGRREWPDATRRGQYGACLRS